jgi:tetratricopeptide (TPR) repeat protein
MATNPPSERRANASANERAAAHAEWLRGALFASASAIVLLALFCPRWNIFVAWSRVPEFNEFIEVRRAATVLQQVEHPFSPLTDPIHRVVRWRLLFPLLGHVLHLPPTVFLALPALGAWLALLRLWQLARAGGCSEWTAWCATTALGATGWFFASTGWLGYFDAWLVLALLTVSHGSRTWTLAAVCVLAPWIDERFIIALPLALGIRYRERLIGNQGALREILRELMVPAAATVAYLVVRIALAGQAGSPGVGEYLKAQQALSAPFSRQLAGLWESLRFAWVFVALGLFAWLRPAPVRIRVALAAIAALTAFVGFAIANDLSRSMTLLLPLAVVGMAWGARYVKAWPAALSVMLVAALGLPARHIVTDFVLPIPRFPAVVQAWKQPVGILAPLTWVERSNGLVAAGRLPEAEQTLAIALRLAPNFAPAYNARGFVAAKSSRWDAALADFARACALEPKEDSFWFNQAFAAQQLQRPDVAARALAEAKRLAKPDSDVARKIAELERGGTLPP